MKRLFALSLPVLGTVIELSQEEAHHAMHVVRLKQGECVELIDGKGNACLGKIVLIKKKVHVQYSDSSPHVEERRQALPLTLGLGVLKSEAMQWVIEKSVELGAERLVPLLLDRSVIEIKKKGRFFFRDRWQKSADQALKQCGRLHRLHIEAPIELPEFLEQKFLNIQAPAADLLFWCDPSAPASASLSAFDGPCTLLVGPEGGWSPGELQLLAKATLLKPASIFSINLGPLILRAETAALYALCAFRLNFEHKLKEIPLDTGS